MGTIKPEQPIVTIKRKYITDHLRNIHCPRIRVKAISAILLLTAVLERSLGDILSSSLALKGINNKKVI